MAGHSKWAQIKRKKAVTDAARSKEFGKFARLITVESKKTGGNLSSPSLRMVIERAKSINMPKENIERAVQKGTSADAAALESVLFEAYGPGGAALLISALTDNNNRTSQEIRHLLSERGVALANPGSAAWAFSKTEDGYSPNTAVDISDETGTQLAELIEALEDHDDVQAVYTNAA